MAPQRSFSRTGSMPSMSELDECSPRAEAIEESSDCVKVYVRVRPFSKREQDTAEEPIALVEQDQRCVVVQAAPPRRFRFDGARGEDSTQEDLFRLVGQGIADGFLDGFNGAVCVYGQTGAGKTYTMVGDAASPEQMYSDPRRGLIWRTLEYVFSEVKKRRAVMPEASYAFRCSFLEIYREQITDLLDSSNASLQLREDQTRGVYVEKLSEPVVSSIDEAYDVLLRGLDRRHTGSTQMNERSSRSHAVFTITMEMKQVRKGISSRQLTRLNLVDLAGSERQMGMADLLRGGQLPGQNMSVKEASAINRSLSALTNVIMNLSREEMLKRKSAAGNCRGPICRRSFVNYRDSKLTFLLKDSLGGNSKTAIVANISPSALCSSETLSSLKFAARAKHIQCSAVRKEEFSASVEDLMREVTTLRRRVLELESGQDSNACAGSTGSSCSRSSCRSSCSTEEDSLHATMMKGAKQEVDLQARLSETKRDLFKAISQLAQVEAKLQLATAEANDLSHEAAKLQAARSNPGSLNMPVGAAVQRLQGVPGRQARTSHPQVPAGISTMPAGGQPQIPSGIATMPAGVPITADAYMAGLRGDGSPKTGGQPATAPNTPQMEPVAGNVPPVSPPVSPVSPVSPSSSGGGGGSSPRVVNGSIYSSRTSPRSSGGQALQGISTAGASLQHRPQLPLHALRHSHTSLAQRSSPRLQAQTPKSPQWAGQASPVSGALTARSQGGASPKSLSVASPKSLTSRMRSSTTSMSQVIAAAA